MVSILKLYRWLWTNLKKSIIVTNLAKLFYTKKLKRIIVYRKKKHTDAVDNITPPPLLNPPVTTSTNATSPSGLSCYLFNPNNKGIFSQEKLSGFSHAYVQPHSKITTEDTA